MRHSWSIPVLLALAALGGYSAGARPVQAQSQPPLISVGERVIVFYGNGTGRSCHVLAAQGTFLRCEPDPLLQPKPEEWINLATAHEFRRVDSRQ
jgi:hypothetical protein